MSRIWKTELYIIDTKKETKKKWKRKGKVLQRMPACKLPAKNQTNSGKGGKFDSFCRLNKQSPFKWPFGALKYDWHKFEDPAFKNKSFFRL